MDLQAYLTANTQNLSESEKTALGITNPVQPIRQSDNKSYTINELYDMVNPNTGKRYVIPFLSPADPEYKRAYADAMRVKIETPEIFERMLRGD